MTSEEDACNAVDWTDAQLLLNEGQFLRCYKMSLHAFEALTYMLAPLLVVGEQQSRRRTGIDPICPINKVHMFLRWLSGVSYHDARVNAGVSTTAFYASVHEVITALLEHPDLQLAFPSGDDESARSFSQLSSNNVMQDVSARSMGGSASSVCLKSTRSLA